MDKRIFFLFFALSLTYCKSTSKRTPVMSTQEKCNIQPERAWVGSSCVSKNSVSYQKFICEKEPNSTWIKEQCVKTSTQKNLQAECLTKNDGSQWIIDAATQLGTCVAGPSRLSTEQSCLASEKGAVWQNGLCINEEARKCHAGGDIWTFQATCVTKEQNDCESKGDGAKYTKGRCVSFEEQTCNDQGYLFIYKAGLRPDSCIPKGYAEFCKDPEAPADIKATMLIMKTENTLPNDCDEAFQVLQQKNSLSYTNKGIANLSPFANLFTNLRGLYLVGNQITDLSPLTRLTKLTTLNVTNNQITNIAPLSKLTGLVGLYLGKNKIKDPSPLKPLLNLDTLDLNHNELSELSAFSYDPTNPAFPKLYDLSINGNCGITSISNLTSLPSLKFVDYNDTSIPAGTIPTKFSSDNISLCGEN